MVGAGNSGVQIATELAQTRVVWLSGHNTGTIPRRLLGKDIFWWLSHTIFKVPVDSWFGRRAADKAYEGDPIFADTATALDRSGAVRVPRTEGIRDGLPQLSDGRVLQVANIIWCTGFRPEFSWIKLPVCDERGYLAQHKGVVRDTNGLFVLGLPALSHLNSGLLNGVGADAEYIADQIMHRSAEAPV